METPQQQFLYYVWVCEVMSQQTQVPRVAEYFAKWMHRWPTVQVDTGGYLKPLTHMIGAMQTQEQLSLAFTCHCAQPHSAAQEVM